MKLFTLSMVILMIAGPDLSLAQSRTDHVAVLTEIADKIHQLGNRFPQLKNFSPHEHLDVEKLSIKYAYHTHKAKPTGGWTSGVPNPDDDGVWFYIDFHDPDSSRQIHTQPFRMTAYGVGGMRFHFLILEGAGTQSVEAELWQIFTAAGIKAIDD